MNAPPALPDRIGEVFEGRYRIEALIGKGGFGAVYRATQLGIGRSVALKVLAAKMAKNPKEVARFEQEARIVAALEHPHIVSLIELGQAADGSLFLVMEYLEGESLARRLRRGRMADDEVRLLGRHMLEALSEAHAQGVIHRDLKPENLFITQHARRGTCLKLLDFGIAKVVGAAAPGEPLTATGMFVGSPKVMAPEQLLGDPVTSRTDLYAFGCVAYLMLTGRLPFVCSNIAAYVRAHLSEAVPPITRDGVALAGPMVDVVMRCLAKDPRARPASADEVLAAWNKAAPRPIKRRSAHVRWLVVLSASLLLGIGLGLAVIQAL